MSVSHNQQPFSQLDSGAFGLPTENRKLPGNAFFLCFYRHPSHFSE